VKYCACPGPETPEFRWISPWWSVSIQNNPPGRQRDAGPLRIFQGG
jgi:hypothetical protein